MENHDEIRSSILALREELQKTQSSYEKMRIYMNLGLSYILLADYENEKDNIINALLSFDEAEKIIRKVNALPDLAEVESNKGFIFYKLAHLEDTEYNLEKSTEHYLNAIELTKDHGKNEHLTKLYYNLANTQLAFKDKKEEHFKEAINYFEKALENAFSLEEEDTRLIGFIYHGLGVAYYFLANLVANEETIREDYLKKSIENFKNALEYFKQEDIFDIASSKSHIALATFELGMLKSVFEYFKEARTYFEQALELYKDRSQEDYGATLFNIGSLLLNASRLKSIDTQEKVELLNEAIKFFEEALFYFPKEDFLDSFVRINYELAVAKRELFFISGGRELIEEIKEHIESIIDDVDSQKNPYTYLTLHFFLGEVYFYLKDKENAIKEYEISYNTAVNFDKELASSLLEVLNKIKEI